MIKIAALLLGFILLVAIVFVVIINPANEAASSSLRRDCALPADPNQTAETVESTDLDTQQIANARLILGIVSARELPARAGEIAIATALQESSLRNLDYGDTAGPDSRGLFQQRPQFYAGVDVMDPAQATNAFLDRLTSDPNWQNLSLSAAAQQVQRSAFPNAYAKWEPVAQSLTAQYGNSPDNPTNCLAPIEANGELATVEGITVSAALAPNLQQLLAASKADGLNLSGWGYRSNQRQVQLRIQNCGGNTNYAKYERPSGQCRPPTARPGRSQHEVGLAIDFTCSGGSISTRTNRCYRWLAANASRFGLINLPSEPWHWSTTGR